MVSLEQVRQLEAKVNRAVEIIRALRDENRTLRRTVDASQARMKDLEDLVRVFKNDQAEIERGLVSAIHKLDLLEDGLDASQRPAAASVSSPTAAAPLPANAVHTTVAAATPDAADDPAEPDAAAEPDDGARPGQLDIF